MIIFAEARAGVGLRQKDEISREQHWLSYQGPVEMIQPGGFKNGTSQHSACVGRPSVTPTQAKSAAISSRDPWHFTH